MSSFVGTDGQRLGMDLLKLGGYAAVGLVMLWQNDPGALRAMAVGALIFALWQGLVLVRRRWAAPTPKAADAFYGDEEIAKLVEEHERQER